MPLVGDAYLSTLNSLIALRKRFIASSLENVDLSGAQWFSMLQFS